MSCHEAAAFMTVWIRNDNYYFAKLVFGSLRDLEMSDLKIACNGVAFSIFEKHLEHDFLIIKTLK